MSQYKRNHTIPRALLKFWIDQSAENDSVHVYDIRKKRSYLSTGRGKNGFSFAIQRDLHVPRVNGARAVALERWMSALEGPMSDLAKQVHGVKAQIKLRTHKEVVRALMGLVALQHRSRYDLAMVQNELDENPALLAKITSGDGTPSKQCALENLVHVVTEQVSSLYPASFTFLHTPDGAHFAMCDRPCFQLSDPDERVVPLTSRTAVLFTRSQSLENVVTHHDVPQQFVRDVNEGIALSARDWIVAISQSQLRDLAVITETDRWRQGVDEDHSVSHPIRYLTSGWRINS